MNAAVKAGLGLAIVVAILNVVFAVAGLHKNPLIGGLIFLVLAIGLNVAAVLWGLKQTAAENNYGKQILSAVVIGAVAGVLIFAFSYLMLTVIFPSYLEESKTASIEWMEAQGMPEAQLDAQIERLEQTTPVSQAMAGLIGTFFTSLIVGGIAGIFLRKK